MKCQNCEVEAGRRGNQHVKGRKFTCKRIKRQLVTKRKWYGAKEEVWMDVEVDSLIPINSDWRSSDEYVSRYVDYADSGYDPYYKDGLSKSYPDVYESRPAHTVESYQSPAGSDVGEYSRSSDSYSAPSTPSTSSWGSDSGSSSSSSSSSSTSSDSSSSSSSSE